MASCGDGKLAWDDELTAGTTRPSDDDCDPTITFSKSTTKPGDKGTPWDLRELLYRLVSNIANVDLRCYSYLDLQDDQLAYDNMAFQMGDPEFLKPDCDETGSKLDPADSIYDQLNLHIRRPELAECFVSTIKDLVKSCFLFSMLPQDPKQAIKSLIKSAANGATLFKEINCMPTMRKTLMCREFVDAYYLACMEYESVKGNCPIKSQVDIWRLRFSSENEKTVTKSIKTESRYKEAVRNIPQEGAHLANQLIEGVLGRKFMKPYVDKRTMSCFSQLVDIVKKLGTCDPKNNPLLCDGYVINILHSLYHRYIRELKEKNANTMTEAQKQQLFILGIQHAFLRGILYPAPFTQQNLSGMFIAVGSMIKEMKKDCLDQAAENDVCFLICEGVYSAFKAARSPLFCQMDSDIWSKFDKAFAHTIPNRRNRGLWTRDTGV